jgi:hypothetical protein
MSRLTNRLKQPKVKTETELRSILGKPIPAPCPVCGSAIFALGHDGALRCIGCHESEANDRRVTAFWVYAFTRPDGTIVAVHHGEDDGYRDTLEPADLPALAGATLAAGGGGGRPSAIRPDGSWDWDLLIPIERALGLGTNPDALSLAGPWINCQFCGTPTLHQSGVCYVCRKQRGL